MNVLMLKGRLLAGKVLEMMKDERGEVNIIAIIIIIAIAVALAIIFRGQIRELFDTIWREISGNVEGAIEQFD